MVHKKKEKEKELSITKMNIKMKKVYSTIRWYLYNYYRQRKRQGQSDYPNMDS